MREPVEPEDVALNARDHAQLSRRFHIFGRVEAPQLDSPMYAELSYGVSQDPELIGLARHTRVGQPPPNMLFAAVQFLLLSGVEHELVVHYPAITGQPRPPTPAFPAFREFCFLHREAIVDSLRTRLTQTNVVLRSACLLPAFAHVHDETTMPLALIEIGCSAGLNLNWDRYRYTYLDSSDESVLTWGDRASPVKLSSSLRGRQIPRLPDVMPVAWRVGVDINPIDIAHDDQVRWLKALIWPEHVERHARLATAVDVARQYPPEMVRGDGIELISKLLARAPVDSAIVVYATFALYQMTREGRIRLFKNVKRFAVTQGRRVDLASMEGTAHGDSQIELHTYHPEGRMIRKLGRANPHGRWLQWALGEQGAEPSTST